MMRKLQFDEFQSRQDSIMQDTYQASSGECVPVSKRGWHKSTGGASGQEGEGVRLSSAIEFGFGSDTDADSLAPSRQDKRIALCASVERKVFAFIHADGNKTPFALGNIDVNHFSLMDAEIQQRLVQESTEKEVVAFVVKGEPSMESH